MGRIFSTKQFTEILTIKCLLWELYQWFTVKAGRRRWLANQGSTVGSLQSQFFGWGTDSKAYCQASNSAASLIMFSRYNCYFLLHWGTRSGSVRARCIVTLPGAVALISSKWNTSRSSRLPHPGMLPMYHGKNSKTKADANSSSRWKSNLEAPGTRTDKLGDLILSEIRKVPSAESNKLRTFASASQNFALASFFCLRLVL